MLDHMSIVNRRSESCLAPLALGPRGRLGQSAFERSRYATVRRHSVGQRFTSGSACSSSARRDRAFGALCAILRRRRRRGVAAWLSSLLL